MVSHSSRYFERLQRWADEYLEAHGQSPATTRDLAVWAIRSKQWQAPEDVVIRRCQEDFAKALREQYIQDGRGRPVRAKHVARISEGQKQFYLWSDIRFAPGKHMAIAFQQRRQQIVGDCRQLKRDVDYFNDAHPVEPQIQMVFDFTEDVEEGEFAYT